MYLKSQLDHEIDVVSPLLLSLSVTSKVSLSARHLDEPLLCVHSPLCVRRFTQLVGDFRFCGVLAAKAESD